jgi:hypothetical protein
MSSKRNRLILGLSLVALVLAILLWGRARLSEDAVQHTIDRMDRDAAAAKAAADAAAVSAGEAMEAARKAQNALPGSS